VGKDNWIYLSHFYNAQTPGYGGKKDFEILEDRCISKGDKCNQFKISMSNHTGTHIDLPFHFHADGKVLQDYSANDWFFEHIECVELNIEKNELIYSHHLPELNKQTECLLLKTNFEDYRMEDTYWGENPGVTEELAKFLKSNYKNLKVVGFDFISATAFKKKEEGRLAHLAFLGIEGGPPILIIEDMKLSSISKTTKIESLHIAPWLIESADGIPVTVSAKIF
jgi:kynurenine formamidase